MQQRLFLIRGLLAIAWTVVFATTADDLTTGVGVLLVLYPLIDAVGSVIDARGQQGSPRQLLELNALISVVAAVALPLRQEATRVTSSPCSASGRCSRASRRSSSPSVGA